VAPPTTAADLSKLCGDDHHPRANLWRSFRQIRTSGWSCLAARAFR